mmetsp:Transcript_30069/g.60153  ORF Transcript_30069/g.60153 Transcript_30069/m.60153 type:complete len:215 (+) Transcript_30069:257-901(+)|eukprot:CAMPEP_0171345226 /NCGR_PEP_ID=MMETSP0878-20121228/21017_1 /TAXON_ID=67004 /ORGANISM="Thalassiosira weissflogii, Strain CCMP1336" /LENGTH=214 /DNA_ID=CAMNT_0011848583 /DNA_START=220 /DNA_END=864 /DNA_ORIENTATION=+
MIDFDSIIGSKVSIQGHIGGVLKELELGTIRTVRQRTGTLLVIEDATIANETSYFENNDGDLSRKRYISFRIDGTNRYLTLNPYGDVARAHALQALATCNLPMLLPDLYDKITEFQIGNDTDRKNWEGQGFNYIPMTAEENKNRVPTLLQSFCLEGEYLSRTGIQSYFGKYWRSQHWDHTISQSSHLERDETWRLTVYPFHPELVDGRYAVYDR